MKRRQDSKSNQKSNQVPFPFEALPLNEKQQQLGIRLNPTRRSSKGHCKP